MSGNSRCLDNVPTFIDQNLNDGQTQQQSSLDAHSMNPVAVLRLAKSMGGDLKRVLVVGCVPATLGPDEGQMGLSEPVTAAVDEAVKLVESLVTRILSREWPAKK